jgi:hypothetical protein
LRIEILSHVSRIECFFVANVHSILTIILIVVCDGSNIDGNDNIADELFSDVFGVSGSGGASIANNLEEEEAVVCNFSSELVILS